MRGLSVLAALLMLTACDMLQDTPKKAVDVAHLGPLTGREQALIVGADGAIAQGNYAAAEKDYLTAIGASTGHVEAHLALARLYAVQHQAAKQREILVMGLQLQPQHPELNYRLGKLLLADGDAQAALDAFKAGLQSAPGNLDLLSAAGVASDMMSQHVQAQRYYTRAVTQGAGSDLSAIRTNLGMSYLLANEPKRAVEILKDEAKKPGASPTTRQNLALAYGALGRNAEARALLHGEMDEETRTLAVARLKEYWNDRSPDKNPLKPEIHDAASAPVSPVGAKPLAKAKKK